MEDRDLKRAARKRLGLGKKLLGQALNGFYYFEDDDVENFIDKMDLRFAKNIAKRRALMFSSVLGNDKIREKVCDAAAYVFGDASCN
jgi:hypothetical protein